MQLELFHKFWVPVILTRKHFNPNFLEWSWLKTRIHCFDIYFHSWIRTLCPKADISHIAESSPAKKNWLKCLILAQISIRNDLLRWCLAFCPSLISAVPVVLPNSVSSLALVCWAPHVPITCPVCVNHVPGTRSHGHHVPRVCQTRGVSWHCWLSWKLETSP